MLAPCRRLVEIPALKLANAVTGEPARLATHVRLAARDSLLLIRFDCRHGGVTAALREDNSPLWTEDVVEVFLAFGAIPRSYFEFEANPLGAKFCARVESPNLSRDRMAVKTFTLAGYSARARVRRTTWSVVLRIPLRTLAAAAGEAACERTRLRANFFRIDRAAAEFSALFPTFNDPPDFHVPEKFGWFKIMGER